MENVIAYADYPFRFFPTVFFVVLLAGLRLGWPAMDRPAADNEFQEANAR